MVASYSSKVSNPIPSKATASSLTSTQNILASKQSLYPKEH